jgi:hypothetical protein
MSGIYLPKEMVASSQRSVGIRTPVVLGPYDTKLSPDDEKNFLAWSAKYPDRTGSTDYDMRGWWKEHGSVDPGGGHFSDKYKKPNHPTFSDESIYSGVDENVGGKWVKGDGGKWSFSASQTNLQHHSEDELRKYFERVESGNTLVLPKR